MLQWARAGTGDRIYREWDDEDQVIVYDTAAGSTHLIEVLGMEVLQLLETFPRTTIEISEALTELFDERDTTVIVDYITTTLQQLQNAGLVVSKSL